MQLARRLRWRPLLVASWVLASAWALALAGTSGPNGITHRLTTPDEYLPELAHVHGLGGYLATFTQHVHDPAAGQFLWSTHVSGGPPGMLLTFAVLARIGLGGPTWAALLVVLAGTAAVPAAAMTARCVAGQAAARRAVPFLTFPVLAIWVATSADAFLLGVAAWGVALLAVAARTASRPRGDAAAVGGGLLLGLALNCSYGIAPLGLLAVAVVVSVRAACGPCWSARSAWPASPPGSAGTASGGGRAWPPPGCATPRASPRSVLTAISCWPTWPRSPSRWDRPRSPGWPRCTAGRGCGGRSEQRCWRWLAPTCPAYRRAK